MATLMGDNSNLLVWPALEIRSTHTLLEGSMRVSGICLNEAQLQRKLMPLACQNGWLKGLN